MKYILIILLLPLAACGQGGWYKPNNTYGTIENRRCVDSTLLIPTGCGTGKLQGFNLHKAAIYFDSCGHKIWQYDPSDSMWSIISSMATVTLAAGRDSITLDSGLLLEHVEIIEPFDTLAVNIGTTIGGSNIAVAVPVINEYANFTLNYYFATRKTIYFSDFTSNTQLIYYYR